MRGSQKKRGAEELCRLFEPRRGQWWYGVVPCSYLGLFLIFIPVFFKIND